MARPWGMLAIAMVLVVAGCTAQPSDHDEASGTNTPSPTAAVPGGSLAFGGGVTDACADGSDTRAFTFAIPVTNGSARPVQLDSAEFEHQGAVDLIGMWVVGPEVSEDDTSASATWSADYPPDASDEPGWPDRTAVGDTVISGRSTTWLAFAITLQDGATTGTIATLTLDYTDEGGPQSITDSGTYGVGVRGADGTISCSAT